MVLQTVFVMNLFSSLVPPAHLDAEIFHTSQCTGGPMGMTRSEHWFCRPSSRNAISSHRLVSCHALGCLTRSCRERPRTKPPPPPGSLSSLCIDDETHSDLPWFKIFRAHPQAIEFYANLGRTRGAVRKPDDAVDVPADATSTAQMAMARSPTSGTASAPGFVSASSMWSVAPAGTSTLEAGMLRFFLRFV
jgi:hypothetical protein